MRVRLGAAALVFTLVAAGAPGTGLAQAGRAPVAPPRTLLRGAALVLTMDPALGEGELGLLRGADVLLDGGRIARVGRGLDPAGARVIDVAGRIVMPGLVDAHNHLWQSLIRGCGAGQDVNGWLGQCVFPLFGFRFTRADAYAAVRLAALDLVSSGVTTTVEWAAGFGPEYVRGSLQALDDSGLRFAFSYFGSADPAVIGDIRLVKATLVDPNPRASLQIGGQPSPFPPFLDDLVASSRLAKDLGVKLHVHLLENVAQRQEGQVQVLELAGAIAPNLLAAHAIHLTDGEIDALGRNGVGALHCPLSNMRLASGVMRLARLRQAGVELGLGLDGGTNDTSDPFNNLRAAVGLQRATSLDPGAFPGVSEALRLATVGGARALGLSGEIGSLTPGKKADVVVLDPRAPNFAPLFGEVSQIVFNAQPANVEWVFVDGRALKERGRLVGVQEARIIEAAQEVSDRVRRLVTP